MGSGRLSVCCCLLLLALSSATLRTLDFNHVLTDPEPASHRRFGHAVAFASEGAPTMAVGSPTSAGAGAVYIFTFERSSQAWQHAQTLTGPASFGSSVALRGTGSNQTLAVGSPVDALVMVFHFNSTGFYHYKTMHGDTHTRFGEKVAFTQSWLYIAEPHFEYSVASHRQQGSVILFREPDYIQQTRFRMPHVVGDPTTFLGVGTSSLEVSQAGEQVDLAVGLPHRDEGKGAVFALSATWDTVDHKFRGHYSTFRPPTGSAKGFGSHISIRGEEKLIGFQASASDHTLAHDKALLPGTKARFIHKSLFLTVNQSQGQVTLLRNDDTRYIPMARFQADGVSAQFGTSVAGVPSSNVFAVGDPGMAKVYVNVPEVLGFGGVPAGQQVEFPVFADFNVGLRNPGRIEFTCPRCIVNTHTHTLTLSSPHHQPSSPLLPLPPTGTAYPFVSPSYDPEIYPVFSHSLYRNHTAYTLHYASPFKALSGVVPHNITLREQSVPWVRNLDYETTSIRPLLMLGQVNVTWDLPAQDYEMTVCLAEREHMHIIKTTCRNTTSQQGIVTLPLHVDLGLARLADSYVPVAVDPKAPIHAFRGTFGSAYISTQVPSFDITSDREITVGGQLHLRVELWQNHPVPEPYREVRISLENPLLAKKLVLKERFHVPGVLVVNHTKDWPSSLNDYVIRTSLSEYPEDFMQDKGNYHYCTPKGDSIVHTTVNETTAIWNHGCARPCYADLSLITVGSSQAPVALLRNALRSEYTLNNTLLKPGQKYQLEWKSTQFSEYHAISAEFTRKVQEDPVDAWIMRYYWVFLVALGVVLITVGIGLGCCLRHCLMKKRSKPDRETQYLLP